MDKIAGFTVMVVSTCLATTVTVRAAVLVSAPLVPVSVILVVPATARLVAVNVKMLAPLVGLVLNA